MFTLAANRSDEEGQLYSDDVFSTYLYTGNGSTQSISNGIALTNTNAWFSIKMSDGDIVSNTVDSAGNIYILSGLSNNTFYSISKFSSSGILQWENKFSVSVAATNLLLTNITIAPDGNIYATGGALSTNFRLYIIKLDTSGNVLFNVLSSLQAIFSKRTLCDSSSNMYSILGNTYYSNGIAKTNSSGVTQWTTILTHAYTYTLISGALDTAGNIIAGGCYDYQSIASSQIPLLIKVSSTGSVIWNKYFTSGYGSIKSVVTDSSNNIYCITSNGYILKLDSSGTKVWEKVFNNNTGFNGGNGNDPIVCLQIDDTTNDLYVLFPTAIYSSIVKLNSSGIVQWSVAFNHTNGSNGNMNLIFKNNLLYYGNNSDLSVIDTSGNISGGTNVMAWSNTSSITTTTSNTMTVTDAPGFTVSAPGDSNFNVPVTKAAGTQTFKTDSIPLTTSSGGMVWIKSRDLTNSHLVYDTYRGINKSLSTETTNAQSVQSNQLNAFSATGFLLSRDSAVNSPNRNDNTYCSWTFRKAPKFFDVVTYTGTGSARTIAHSLGVAPGMVIVKRTDTTGNWQVYHRSLTSAAYSIQLNLTDAQASAPTVWNSTAPTSSVFSVGTDATVNASGGTYVAYLYAHDTSSTGIIQCGSFVSDSVGNGSATLGWEPQYLLMKKVSVNVESWFLIDTMRGASQTNTEILYPNLSNATNNLTFAFFVPNATGFTFTNNSISPNATFIYMAIRRPNKPPTTGTQVYNAIARTGTGAAATVTGAGFPPDLAHISQRSGSAAQIFASRLTSNAYLDPTGTDVETTTASVLPTNPWLINGISVGAGGTATNGLSGTYINHFFKRAPGFFDVVCYTGTGTFNTTVQTVSHGLGVVPEMIIYKNRSSTYGFSVYHSALGVTKNGELDTDRAAQTDGGLLWNSVAPTASSFTAGPNPGTQNVGNNYVAYLFATLAGISKVGSYTGNGTSQTINCGFAAGARFVLIKRTDSTGDWYVWDTSRGIVTGNDPHLSLNTTVAEVTTDDSIDPYSPGFAVNQVAATNINVTSATYIFLAIA